MLTSGRRSLGQRRTATCLLIVTIALSAFVGLTSVFDAPAHATCSGGGSPTYLYSYDGYGRLVAEESVAYPGTTCDGDSYYVGAVYDARDDNSCAYAYYLEPFQYYGTQGITCTTYQWSVYSYHDTIGANSVYVSVRTSYQGDAWFLSWGY